LPIADCGLPIAACPLSIADLPHCGLMIASLRTPIDIADWLIIEPSAPTPDFTH
jgi:hypothetical protein